MNSFIEAPCGDKVLLLTGRTHFSTQTSGIYLHGSRHDLRSLEVQHTYERLEIPLLSFFNAGPFLDADVRSLGGECSPAMATSKSSDMLKMRRTLMDSYNETVKSAPKVSCEGKTSADPGIPWQVLMTEASFGPMPPIKLQEREMSRSLAM